MIQEPVRVRLELESHPESVALIRAALSGLAAATSIGDELLADLKTAVSEACNNAVIHAYDGHLGPLSVEFQGFHNGIKVIVTDSGSGIRQISGGEDRMGLGLALISALADRSEFRTPPGGGTEVRMWFERVIEIAEATSSDKGSTWPPPRSDSVAGDVVAWLSPVELTRFVLGRVVRSLAASAHFSMTRVSDLRAVNDAIAEYAEVAADGGLAVGISTSTRRLSITGGPFSRFDPESASTLQEGTDWDELKDRRHELEAMVDALSSEPINNIEMIHLLMVEEASSSA